MKTFAVSHNVKPFFSLRFICRHLLLLLAFTCLTALLPGPVEAQFDGGSGNAADPYLVATAAQLNLVREHLDAHFKLIADINLAGEQNWTSIGDLNDRFTGRFDGGGHVISNLTIHRPLENYQGLFGYLDEGAAVVDLTLLNVDIHGHNYTGGLAGRIRDRESTVEQVAVSGRVVGTSYTGGVAGSLEYGSLQGALSNVEVTGNNTVGGLVGGLSHGASVYHGGSLGSVTGNSDVGGLVGYSGHSLIADCYSRATVDGDDRVGGLVGRNYAGSAEVHRSYSAGAVSGSGDYVGGLAGRNEAFYGGPVIIDSYWDIQASGQEETAFGGGEGRTTAQMQQQETYLNYNFYTLWQLDQDSGYPQFRDLSDYRRQPEAVGLQELPGGGTPENPYLIGSADELNAVRQDLSASYRLVADIDLAESLVWNQGAGWQPIGDAGSRFFGTFDGNGYVIGNLTINRPKDSEQGLFGYLGDGARVYNLNLHDVSIMGRGYTGALAGRGNGNDVRIEQVTVTGRISGRGNTGGLLGYQFLGELTYITGNVSVKGSGSIGGLVGAISSADIHYSSSLGSVTGDTDVGGLVGYNGRGLIADSYSRAKVSGDERVGGLVGRNYAGSAEVQRSYSAGAVSGSGDYVGGLAGRNEGFYGVPVIIDSYWDTQVSGQQDSAGGEGRTTAQMTYPHGADTYLVWDFLHPWVKDTALQNGGYPYLWSTEPPPTPSRLFLAGGLDYIKLDHSAEIAILPGQTLGQRVYIELAPGTGSIRSLPSSLLTRAVIDPGTDDLRYTFDANLGVIKVQAAQHATVLASLPVDGNGFSPYLTRLGQAFRLQVDPNTLDVDETPRQDGWSKPTITPGNAASLLYLPDDIQQVTITGNTSLQALPQQQYGDMDILLQGAAAQISDISASIAGQARFTLEPADQYQYSFNVGQGTVQVSNGSGLTVLTLPVNAQGETSRLRIGTGDYSRLRVEEDGSGGYKVAEGSLPQGEAILSQGQIAYEAGDRAVHSGGDMDLAQTFINEVFLLVGMMNDAEFAEATLAGTYVFHEFKHNGVAPYGIVSRMEIIFDGFGNGSFITTAASDGNTETGTFTYSVASDGAVTFAGMPLVGGSVSADGNVVIFHEMGLANGSSHLAVGVRKSTELSKAILDGEYVIIRFVDDRLNGGGYGGGYGGAVDRIKANFDGAGGGWATAANFINETGPASFAYNINQDGVLTMVDSGNSGIVNQDGQFFVVADPCPADGSVMVMVGLKKTW